MTSTLNLIASLQQIPDYRKGKGKRHALWLVLTLILLGTLCGYRGYRPLADFSQRHWNTLCNLLQLPPTTRIPSYSTFRRVLHQVDFQPLVALFNQWSHLFLPLVPQTWVACDGKSIKSTLTDYTQPYQDFITSVSAFTHTSGVVVQLQMMHNQQTSEIEVVRQLIQSLAGKPIVFTLDALHCQKKTVEQISQQQQHYLITLKANQQKLYEALKQLHATLVAESTATRVDRTHQREVHRRAWVYVAPDEWQQQWAGLSRLIWVERWGTREGKAFHEEVGYISDLSLSAEAFLQHIQQHWGIENRLHWVRDVTFEEDVARPGGHAPVIWAVLNCFVVSMVRQLGFRTIPQGVRALTNQVQQVFEILTHGFSSA